MDTDFSSAFMAAVKRHRLKKKISLAKVAKLAGLTQTYPGALERSLYSPTIDVCKALAKALEVPLWKLVKEAEGNL